MKRVAEAEKRRLQTGEWTLRLNDLSNTEAKSHLETTDAPLGSAASTNRDELDNP